MVFRTDYVSPGSILLTSSVFNTIKSQWSLQFWRQWIQSDAVRQGRACIRPEINRVIPFNEISSSHQKYFLYNLSYYHSFDWDHQKDLVLQSSYIDFSNIDFSYLVKVEIIY